MERRTFIKSACTVSAALALSRGVPGSTRLKNKLPKWKGFNLRDFNAPSPAVTNFRTTEEHLKWMSGWGFDFIRLPMAYPYYLKFDRNKPVRPEDVYSIDESAVEKIEQLVYLAHKHNLHVSLNLHRAPGYCINAGFHEPYNLWKDEPAQDAFYFHWNMWAKRFRSVSAAKISFDLLNEPSMRSDMNDQHSRSTAIPSELYKRVAAKATEAIRLENRNHLVIADGNSVGNDPVPELAGLGIAQSCRGYFPHYISHYKAPWANKDPDRAPVPEYPGSGGGGAANRQSLEKYYKPWIKLMQEGVGIHCGECGAWNKTPHDVFLRWFSDVTDILTSNGVGFALWEFIGDFGLLDSGRSDVAYESWHGHKLDRKLLDLCVSR